MAPMTRSRAKFDGTPGELAAEYYSQRASVGLIVTEGSQPSDDGQGYLATPGIYSPVRKDLEDGRLCVLPIEDVPPDGLIVPMSVVWQTKSPPGPAGRWFIDRLKQIPVETGKAPKPPVTRKKARRSAKTQPDAGVPIARSDG